MIVTFHMAVYFAYHIWNEYVSNYVFGVRRDINSNDNRDNSPIVNSLASGPAEVVNDASRSGVPQDQSDLLSVNNRGSGTNVDSEKKVIVKEALQILHKIEFGNQEEGRRIIYDVEPEFYSIFAPERNTIQFIPPVYIQRYMVVDGIIRNHCWSSQMLKVIEFGCAELSFIWRYLKRMDEIREIVAVDIDRGLLERHMIKLSPTATDYLKRRPTPLNIKVFKGSVADTNICLESADAVIAIELIEHLFPPELERLPFTIFGFIKPKLAIFTTPNVDFNVLFGGALKFRHDDHKFEWTRQQFEDWGNKLVETYPDYSVTFQGIGPGPEGTEQYGFCSQMAIFVKQNEIPSENPNDLNIQDGTYELLVEYEYPYDKRSEDQKIRDEAVGFLNACDNIRRRYYSGDDENENTTTKREISLADVMSRINCFDKDKVKDILLAEKWEITTNSDGNEAVVLSNCEDYEESFSDYYDEYDRHDEVDEDINHLTYEPVTTNVEEIWNDEIEPVGSNFTNLECFDCISSVNNLEKVVSNPNEKVGPVNNCTKVKAYDCDMLFSSHGENVFVPEIKTMSCPENITLEQSNLNLSVYETPCVNEHTFKKQSQSSSGSGFKKKLPFDVENECCGNQSMCDSSKCQSILSSANNFFDSVSIGNPNSPCDVSVYSTPCGSESHRKNVPKSFSLQQIENSSVSKVKECFSDKMHNFSDEEVKKVSRSLEGLKNEGSFEKCKSFPSLSRVIDSGYPDSNSEQEMDLDLTLEQFDEIDSLSDNESNSLPSPVHPVANLPHLIDDVENGDVANNNRDGEGNNLIADMDEEPLEFEAQIQVDNEVLNFDGDDADMDIEPMDYNGQIEDCDETNMNGLPEETIDEKQSLVSKKISCSNRDGQSVQNKNSLLQIPAVSIGCDEDRSKPTPSTTSIGTTSSWNCEETAINGVPENTSRCLKTHNSLTTVLDGFSKFSECSLVKASDKSKMRQITGKIPMSNTLPEWLVHIGDLSSDFPSNCSHLDSSSIKSIYESTESLVSNTSETIEHSSFPKWLLDLSTEDNNLYRRDSDDSMLDADSYYNIEQFVRVSLDPRGGGDPQRDTWS